MQSTIIHKIRSRDKRLKYPKSIITLEVSRTQTGSLILNFTHERFPDNGMVFQTFKTAFWVDGEALSQLRPAERIRLDGVL